MSESKHVVKVLRPSTGGVRRFAVVPGDPAVRESWSDNTDIPCQGDQQWDLWVRVRIEGRGYVAFLQGSGQWANRGDHGAYIGTGATAEAALLDAWGRGDYQDYEGDPPNDLLAACRDHDAEVNPPEVE